MLCCKNPPTPAPALPELACPHAVPSEEAVPGIPQVLTQLLVQLLQLKQRVIGEWTGIFESDMGGGVWGGGGTHHGDHLCCVSTGTADDWHRPW